MNISNKKRKALFITIPLSEIKGIQEDVFNDAKDRLGKDIKYAIYVETSAKRDGYELNFNREKVFMLFTYHRINIYRPLVKYYPLTKK